MKISVRDLSFGYGGKLIFDVFSAEFGGIEFNGTELDGEESSRPVVILGPSGCGKTSLLKLLGGLLKPGEGRIIFSEQADMPDEATGKTAFVFQEPRLLPWLTVIKNISLPLEKDFGSEEAQRRARHLLALVALEEKEDALPAELSGGQAQRVSMARAFAWPAPALFMDEPFQSLDIPLRINLMDLTLSLLSKEKRLLIAVTHDPREAIYMGGRIIVLGDPGKGIVYDRIVTLHQKDRSYGSAAAGELERELISAISR
jgi:NitT/TauT family transport system ATP-binding protein